MFDSDDIIDKEKNEYHYNYINENQFKMPWVAFVDVANEITTMEHLIAFAYLCYIAYKINAYDVNVDLEIVEKRTGFSKKKFITLLDEILQMGSIPYYEKEGINKYRIESINQEITKDNDDEEIVIIPKMLRADWESLGMNFEEKLIIYEFFMLVNGGKMTMEKIIKKLARKTRKRDAIKEEQLFMALEKAKTANLFTIKKLPNGNIDVILRFF